ncbi:MAG: hypothetical protein U9R00_02000 [Patescibacteria group bacterium]|nr:hypothetical protein [Patescibacteria group bacterium]
MENFEKQKKQHEEDHEQKEDKRFLDEINEIFKKNPIKFYEDSGVESNKKIDNVKSISSDKSGTGGKIGIEFTYDDYVSVNKKSFNSGGVFNYSRMKIDDESFHNILTAMDKLIKKSGYSEVEKEKMFNMVVDKLDQKKK